MKTSELIKSILNEIEILSDDSLSINLFVRLESGLAFLDFLIQLQKMKYYRDVPNETILEPILTFISNRFHEIKKTDAIYFHHPDTKINRAVCIAAYKFSEVLSCSILNILLPNVSLNVLEKEDLQIFKPKHFILTDDGAELIKVSAALKAAINFSKEKHARKLTKNERKRIAFHSEHSMNYLKQKMILDGLDVEKEKMETAFCEYENALKQNNYIIQASYGKKGFAILKSIILKKIDYNFSKFVGLMNHYLFPFEWGPFLKEFSDETLLKVILSHAGLIESIKNLKNYEGNPEHDRAVLYCFAEVYKKERGREEEFKTRMASFSKYTMGFFGGYSKQDKLAATEFFQDFLCNHDYQLNEFETFIKRKNPDSRIKKVFSDWNVMGMPTLTALVSQAKIVFEFSNSNAQTNLEDRSHLHKNSIKL